MVYTLVLEEVASYENEELGTVDIMTDARQVGGRMQRTKVVWPLEKRHKFLSCKNFIKSDDSVTQRHGTEKIYQHLKNQNATVGVHVHDRNLSINKFIREECDS